jgi:hypothetical protein
LQKVKSYFFANIYHSPFDTIEIPKKYKIEAPYPAPFSEFATSATTDPIRLSYFAATTIPYSAKPLRSSSSTN